MMTTDWKPIDFYTIEDGKPVHYRRAGECHRCGKCCCEHHTIRYKQTLTLGSEFPELEDWAEWEGYTLFFAQGIWWWFLVYEVTDEPSPCFFHDKDGRGCKIWNDPENFPMICRYWPFRTVDLEQFPECGFSFERADD